jgi:heat shock protein HslJ
VADTEITSVTNNISIGMKGDGVKNLQAFLVKFGYLDSSNQTGYFGQKTLIAVKKFQKAYSISSTGFIGKLTREKINQILVDSRISYSPIGGDKDSHGCVLGGGYSWSEAQKACVRPWEKVTNTLTSGTWNLFELDKKSTSGLTFSIKDGRINIRGCNSMSGSVEIDEANKTIKAGMMVSTMMACMETEKMQLDQIASSVFASATVGILTDNVVKISSKDHSLLFSPSN